MTSGDNIRRANRRLLLALALFAVLLCALVLAWMYGRMKRAERGDTISGQRGERISSLPPPMFACRPPAFL